MGVCVTPRTSVTVPVGLRLRRSQASRRTTTLSPGFGAGVRPARAGSRTMISREMRGSSGTTNHCRRLLPIVPVSCVSARLTMLTTVPVPQSSPLRSRRLALSFTSTRSPWRATCVSSASMWSCSRGGEPGTASKTTRAEPLGRKRIVPSRRSAAGLRAGAPMAEPPKGRASRWPLTVTTAPALIRRGMVLLRRRRSSRVPPRACTMASRRIGL